MTYLLPSSGLVSPCRRGRSRGVVRRWTKSSASPQVYDSAAE